MRDMDAPKVTIEVLASADEPTVEAFERLIPMLSTSAAVPDRDTVARVLAHPANTVYAARAGDGRILGLTTLVMIELATGLEARIEDVVVDDAARGLGAGRALVAAALEAAAERGVRYVDLTSSPRRVAARALYAKLGFVARDTGVFRHDLTGYRD